MVDDIGQDVHHLFDGTETRFDASLQNMLKRMTQIFGVDWWNYVVIGVSFWAYDQDSIDDRVCEPDYPQYCKDEAWFCNQTNSQLRDKLHVEKNFTCVFTDSFSQTGNNVEDPLQQEHWRNETGILWEITTGREDTFGFMTVDDILEENARLKEENRWLNDVIRNNITQLTEMIQSNVEKINTNEGNVQANAGNIQDSTDNLDILEGQVNSMGGQIVETNMRIDENKAYIDQNTADINQHTISIDENTAHIDENKADIGENTANINQHTISIDENTAHIVDITENIDNIKDNIDTLNMAPVGTIIAWTPKPNKDSTEKELLPKGWQECDGTEISEGIWKGQKTPNINGEERFLRGTSNTINVLDTEEDQVKELYARDVSLFFDHCPSGWRKSGTRNPDDWSNLAANEDPYCERDRIVDGTVGEETRPKNIHV